MDKKVNSFIEKAKVSASMFADRTGKAATRAAGAASKTATGVMETTKLNLQIFDLNAEIEVLYKELGRMVYDVHGGAQADQEEMKAKLTGIDERLARIEEIRAQLNEVKKETVCPNCGKECPRDAAFCSSCGAQL